MSEEDKPFTLAIYPLNGALRYWSTDPDSRLGVRCPGNLFDDYDEVLAKYGEYELGTMLARSGEDMFWDIPDYAWNLEQAKKGKINGLLERLNVDFAEFDDIQSHIKLNLFNERSILEPAEVVRLHDWLGRWLRKKSGGGR